jgi:alpha-beta hydrolase superfamily lysophospholipase
MRPRSADPARLAWSPQVGLDWLEAPSLPVDAPVLLILHTITGTSRDFLALAKDALARGLRPVVCLRRGHTGAPLTAPRVNLLGCTADLRAQVAFVQARFPTAPILALGSSAGTGLLVRYLGEEGANAPVAAAVAVCPGYDTGPGKAFSRFSPSMDAHILKAIKRFFLRHHNEPLLRSVLGYADVAGAKSIAAYQEAAYALEGYSSVSELHENTNPMRVAHDIRVPICVINAADDPVCSVQARRSVMCVLCVVGACADVARCRAQNVHDNASLFDAPHDRMLLLTDRGSHCTFYEARLCAPVCPSPDDACAHATCFDVFRFVRVQGLWWPNGSWCDRVALEYMEAVLALRKEAAEAADAAPAEAAVAAA